MRFLTYVLVASLVPSLARAQAGFSPPPLVEAPPPEPGQAPPRRRSRRSPGPRARAGRSTCRTGLSSRARRRVPRWASW
jgi:hypothetical protein